MSEITRYGGRDVHKATIAVAIAEPDGSVTGYGTVPLPSAFGASKPH